MKIAVEDNEKALLSIVLEYVNTKCEEKKDIKTFMDLTAINLKNIKFLKDLIKSIRKKEPIKDANTDIWYKYENGQHTLKVGSNEPRTYDFDLIEIILSKIISTLEPILPLGTVVKLKKERIKKIVKYINEINEEKSVSERKLTEEELDDIELIIEKRFVKINIEGKYAEYAANIYPISTIEKIPQFIFSNDDIEEILYKGYVNEKEEAYVTLIKSQLIKEDLVSIGTVN